VKLNPAQKRAVDAIEGPVMVVAGPGTGKTQILTLRIANILLQTDTAPENILALTFTESGAYSMRKRLAEIIGTAAYKVRIGTFHGFCNEVIQKYPEEFPRIIGGRNASEVDQIKIIEEILERGEFDKLRPYGDILYYVRPILGSIRTLKREGVLPEEFAGVLSRQKKEFENIPDLYHEKGAHAGKMKGKYIEIQKQLEKNRELALAYEAYQEKLAEKKFYDYEDMIMEVVRTLREKADFRLILQEEYQYILADEHQDTNTAQNKILELLSGFHEQPNLFVVGDEKQAIFRFQGATLDNFLYFKKIYPGAILISLEENYRSTQAILDGAGSVIENNAVKAEGLRKRLLSQKQMGEKIKVYTFSKSQFEYLFLCEDIERKISKGVPAREIAVLYRDNKDVFPIARYFEKTGIPFVIESDRDALSDENIAKLILLLRAIGNIGDNDLLAQMLYIDFLNIEPLDIYKALSWSGKEKMKLCDTMRSREHLLSAGVGESERFIAVYKKLSSWSTVAKNKSLLEFFEIVVRESGLLEHLLSAGDAFGNMETLHAFFEEMKTLSENHKEYALSDFLKYLDILRDYNVLVKTRRSIQKNGIRLMTAHKSKGLEFDFVYIAGAYDTHFGNRRSHDALKISLKEIGSIEAGNEDERRLFFVAMTRAREEVVISSSEEGADGRSRMPSQFIGEIREGLSEKIDVSEMEARFLTKEEFAKEFKSAPKKTDGSDVKDKEFLNALFLDQGLSVTALNNYLRCPWEYFYNNLLRIPKPYTKHQMYGIAVHGALKEFFDTLREEEKGKDFLLSRFEYHLLREPFRPAEYDESLEKGRKALGGWHDAYAGTWEKNILNEYRVSGVSLETKHEGETAHILLKGNLDKVEILSDGRVNVVDYKTAKPRSRNDIEGKTKSSEGDYKRQLVFYKLLLDRFERGKFNMQTGEIDFIEPNDRGQYKKEKFEILSEEVGELEKIILRVAEEILSLSFWNARCGEPKCESCALRSMMR
jgi:DNA helicase-2/ATP-dependent DNA helicase PcrA